MPGFSGPEEKSDDSSVPRVHDLRVLPSLSTLRAALTHEDRPHHRFSRPRGMSNSWAVSGDLTDSGHAMLANDPHLGLDSPTDFYQSHLVVEPREPEDGPALNTYGIIFPGLPGVLIGHNANIAWGLTTASYDYVDAFVEQLVWREGEEWPRVMHDGAEVALTIYEEEIELGGPGGVSEPITVELPWVPHRGPIIVELDGREAIPPSRDSAEAISLAWRAFEPSNEIAAVMGWILAENVADARAAAEAHWTIGTQNLLFADLDGNIFTTGASYIPQRPAAAMSWDPVTNPGGTAPWLTLSGTGEHDWLDDPLPISSIPHALNPAEGFIVTANNDQAGTTDDDNPLNDFAYLGYDYDLGFRAGRIRARLTNDTGEWPDDHAFSLDDVGSIQADYYSSVGARTAPFLLAVADDMLEEYDAPGTHPDLAELIDDNTLLETRVLAMRELLGSWNYWAEDGLWGDPSDEQREMANATALFNVWTTAVIRATFDDERHSAGLSLSHQNLSTGLLWILEHPADTATFDEAFGESVLWDDLETEDVRETRQMIIADALFTAHTQLGELFGSTDTGDWIWGELHTRTFSAQVPDVSQFQPGLVSEYLWPQPDEAYPDGYPRPGDNYNADACNGGVTDYDYACGGGATLRFLVELDPDGIRSFNAVPGGQVHDHTSPHARDLLMDYWLDWERYAIRFHPDEVAAAGGSHVVLR